MRRLLTTGLYRRHAIDPNRASRSGWITCGHLSAGIAGMVVGSGRLSSASSFLALAVASALIWLSYRAVSGQTRVEDRRYDRALGMAVHLHGELELAGEQWTRSLAVLLDARDRTTHCHCTQVEAYAVALGEQMKLPADQLETLRKAALLHDIGKVGIPDSILLKSGPLTETERRVMQTHAEIGHRILSQVAGMAAVAETVWQHHEWHSGGGYPRGLSGRQIRQEARIIGVADALDTISSDRPYRKGRPLEEAFAEICRCSGTQFDPQVVDALEELVRERGHSGFAVPGLVRPVPPVLEVAAGSSK